MLLGAALQELKIKKSKLARLYRLREDTFNVLENKSAEVEFGQVSNEINELVQEIRDLKVKIAKTNAYSTVSVEGRDICIQELILLIGDLRSELMQHEALKPRGPVYLGGQAVEYIPQRKQDEIAAAIAELEQRKADLDKILQAQNWMVELVD
jgi:DNA repair exonuclease SbcCD ATPase subunit